MNAQQLVDRLRALGGGGLRNALRPVVLDAIVDLEGRAKDNITARMFQRGGHLRRSIAASAEDVGTDVYLHLRAGGTTSQGRSVVYARIQEEGGIIRPRSAKYLRIPLKPARTRAGSDRYATPLRITGAGQFVCVRDKDTNKLFLYKLTDKGNKSRKPWYLLTKGPITIRGKHFLRDARDSVARELPGRIQEAVAMAVAGAR